MVLDYRERTRIGKKHNKKHPAGHRPVVVFLALMFSFVLGASAAWLFFKAKYHNAILAQAAGVPARPLADTPEVGLDKIGNPKLTFYYTLPKGTPPLGSGINAPRKNNPPVHAAGSEPVLAMKPAPLKRVDERTGKKFTVQVASYQSKKDAETVQSRLSAGGMAAYIVESTLPDKGMWYRVRVGKNLEHAMATTMAAKAGNGAIVVEE